MSNKKNSFREQFHETREQKCSRVKKWENNDETEGPFSKPNTPTTHDNGSLVLVFRAKIGGGGAPAIIITERFRKCLGIVFDVK